MKHIDILIHVITLLSGIMTTLLGFLLYLKYKIKAIRYYALSVANNFDRNINNNIK